MLGQSRCSNLDLAMDKAQQNLLDQYCAALEGYGTAVRNLGDALRVVDQLAINSARRAVASARLNCVKALGVLDGPTKVTNRRTQMEILPHIALTQNARHVGQSA